MKRKLRRFVNEIFDNREQFSLYGYNGRFEILFIGEDEQEVCCESITQPEADLVVLSYLEFVQRCIR